jgi:hypothetical protein
VGGRKHLPRIRSGIGQPALSTPDLVDQFKEDMLGGKFRYESREGRIYGWKDKRETYYICEGHHRVVAALEIFWETGDRSYVDRLLECGTWDNPPPRENRRLPTRSVWSRLLSRLGW